MSFSQEEIDRMRDRILEEVDSRLRSIGIEDPKTGLGSDYHAIATGLSRAAASTFDDLIKAEDQLKNAPVPAFESTPKSFAVANMEAWVDLLRATSAFPGMYVEIDFARGPDRTAVSRTEDCKCGIRPGTACEYHGP
jgi:hypothetical protein